MTVTLKLFVDPNAPGSQQLTHDLEKQVRALGTGTVESKKGTPPEGTLTDPHTVLLVVKLTYYSLKVALALIAIARDVRERHAAEKKQKLENVAPIFITVEGDTTATLSVPGSAKDEQQFLSTAKDKEA